MRFHFVIRAGNDIILPGMSPLMLHEFHHGLSAQFSELNGAEVVNDYGDWLAEHAALRESAGVLDLSFRSRICLAGADRVRFLHGQVTNDVKKLCAGEGCYAAITTAKGKMESDLNIFALADELLLDFEPGLTEKNSARLEKFIVADDVQIVDAAPHYGLLSVQGPKAADVIVALSLIGRDALPRVQADRQVSPTIVKISDAMLGKIYLVNNPRLFSFPLPAQRGEGQSEEHSINQASSPRPSPPFMEEREKLRYRFRFVRPQQFARRGRGQIDCRCQTDWRTRRWLAGI